MQITKQELTEIIQTVVDATINALETKGVFGKQNANPKMEKTAYQRTEQLLYNYNGFKKIVEERKQEINELYKYGVPKRSSSFEFVPHSNTVTGIMLPEESVEQAVRTIENNISETVGVLKLIDNSMAALSKDPYYNILPMRYFEGRTQEDIAVELKCDQATISRNRSRLVKELAMRIFPNQVVTEMLA